MSTRPVLLLSHPRACSTAFERVFLTCPDITCFHEPFCDPFHFGPESIGERYQGEEKARAGGERSKSTYGGVLENILGAATENKRIFIKDMAKSFIPSDERPASISPSLRHLSAEQLESTENRSLTLRHGDVPNPTVLPLGILQGFHITFLIRHPRLSVPSLYKRCVPPLSSTTGWRGFQSSDLGYAELHQLFDYLRGVGQIGPNIARLNRSPEDRQPRPADDTRVDICVVDAEDLLKNPEDVITAYCRSVYIKFDSGMLSWGTPEGRSSAETIFGGWKGWHDDAIMSTGLNPSTPPKTQAELYAEWEKAYGKEGADTIDLHPA
ncbi:MAG: helicase [Geoglossum simile]|nr:MAG: helicase [Geoglossum simile]